MALTTESKFTTTLAKLAGGLAAILSLSWGVFAYVTAQRDFQMAMLTELRDIKREMAVFNKESVTQTQFKDWSVRLRWENRQSNMFVPETREFIPN